MWRLILMVLSMAAITHAADYPPLTPLHEADKLGVGYQRTMRKLAESTPEKRNKVHILFYGQSITASGWPKLVEADLRKRFPHADLKVENLAISGFASQLLERTAYHDVPTAYPDLVIFHVYGAHDKYEQLIAEIRRRTTAEIIMQSDHATNWPAAKATGNFWQTQPDWGDKMNYFLLPSIAEKYRCAFEPQRWEWVDYMKAHKLEPKDLLKDAVHLNAHGEWLMAAMMNRYLQFKPERKADDSSGKIRTFEIGKDAKWQGNRLKIEFEGNRVVALATSDDAQAGNMGSARVLIDGKSPAEFASAYTVTRSNNAHGGWFPAVKRVTWQNKPELETWTVTCRNFNESHDDFEFEVVGSVTGPDGSGRAKESFVSKSGRVVIAPEDWSFDYGRKMTKSPAPDGFKVTWTVEPEFVEHYRVMPMKSPVHVDEQVLVSDLPNGPHTLELVVEGGSPPPLKAIRVHQPPLR